MPTVDRRGLSFVCALVAVSAFPMSLLFPPAVIVSVLGMAATYFLWSARSYLLLALALVVSFALIGGYGGVTKASIFLVGLALPALLMAFMRKRGSGAATAVAAGVLLPALAVVVRHQTFAKLMTFLASDLKRLAASAPMAPLYSPAQYSQFIELVNRAADRISYFFPALMVCFVAAAFLTAIAIGNFVVRSAGIFLPPLPHFSMWKLPEWVIIPLGASIIMVLTNQEALAIIGWNALLFFFLLYSVFGLSFLEYQMHSRRFPVPVKIVIYLFLFFTQLLAAVVLPLVALFDSKFDFRKVRAKRLG